MSGDGNFSEVQDSGAREEFEGGSVRDTREGKGRMDLLPPVPLIRLARWFELGANKYGPSNWRKGQPISRFYDSAFRHLLEYWNGNTEEDPLIAAIWNLVALLDTQDRIARGHLPLALDDHPARETAPLLVRALRENIAAGDPDDCWEWSKSRTSDGYGSFQFEGRVQPASRVMCLLAHGEPPTPDHVAMHSCDNPPCVNPRHLSWGTRRDNFLDARKKERNITLRRPSRLTDQDKAEIRRLRGEMTQIDVAKRFKISPSYVSLIQLNPNR